MSLSTGEITSLRDAYELSFNDEGHFLVRGFTYDDLNQPIETYTTGTAISCGYDATGGAKRRFDGMTIQEYPAAVRVASSVSVNATDLFLLTKRFGADVTPEAFEIMGIDQGYTGKLVGLKHWDY